MFDDLDVTPVIPGFHPDPSVCRVGETYVLATSSFEYAPAVPVFTSRNLVRWEQIGNALDRPSQFAGGHRGPSMGIFAPTIRHHDGRFWLITTDVDHPDPTHQLLVTASDPAGPWSEPVHVPVTGIDPDIAWDDSGTCLVTWAAPGHGSSHIMQVSIDDQTGVLLEEPRSLWSGTGGAYPEAPHLHRRGDWWYLLIAEGGTERGHSVSIARSASPRGPFEGCPSNPILTHRGTTHPVQNTGHADLVERSDGSWAMLYLGVRPRGGSPGFHVNGRETFLANVDWIDDWPAVITDKLVGRPANTSFTDTFTGNVLHPRWVSPAGFPTDFSTLNPDGGVTITAGEAPNGTTPSLGFRTADPYWSTEIILQEANAHVAVAIDQRHRVVAHLDTHHAELHLVVGPLDGRIGSVPLTDRTQTTLRIRSRPSRNNGPDELEFTVDDGHGEQHLGRVDGRYTSTEVAAGFTGRLILVETTTRPLTISAVAYSPGAEE